MENVQKMQTETVDDGNIVHLFMFQRQPIESACPDPRCPDAVDFPAICALI